MGSEHALHTPTVTKVTSFPEDTLGESIRRVLITQLVIAAVSFVGLYLMFAVQPAFAGAWGTGIGLIATVLTGRSVKRASAAAQSSPGVALVPVYSGVLQKLLVAGVGVTFGIAVLGFEAIFVLLGLAASQFAYLVAAMPRFRGNGLNNNPKV